MTFLFLEFEHVSLVAIVITGVVVSVLIIVGGAVLIYVFKSSSNTYVSLITVIP